MRNVLSNLRLRRNSRDREIGISLVEILVYIALFAVLSIMITSIVTNTINNTQRITATSTTSAAVNTAASNLQRDLSLAQKITYAGVDRIDYEAAINGVGYQISIFEWSNGNSTTGVNSLPNVPSLIPDPADRTVLYQMRKNMVTGATSFTILLDGYNPQGISKPLFVYYDNENAQLDPAAQLDGRTDDSADVSENQVNRNKIARIEFNIAANVSGRATPLQISSSVTPFFNGGIGVYQPPAGNNPGTPQCVTTFTADVNSNGVTAADRRTTVLRWNAPYGATSYTIHRYDMGEGLTTEIGADEPIVILDPNQTSLYDNGSSGGWILPQWGHTYKYTITVAYSYGLSAECLTVLGTIQPEPPTIVNIQPYAYGPTTADFTQADISVSMPSALNFTSGESSFCGSAGISGSGPAVSMFTPTQGGASLQAGPGTVNPMTSRATPIAPTDNCYSNDVTQQNYYYSVARGLVNQISWSWSRGATEYYIRHAGSNTNLATLTLANLHAGGGTYDFVWQDTAPSRVTYGATNTYVIVANNPGGESLPSNTITLVSPPRPPVFLQSTEADNPSTTVDNPGTPYLIETVEGAPGTDATRPDTGTLNPDGNTKNNIILADNSNTNATAFVVYRNTGMNQVANCASPAISNNFNFTTGMTPITDVLSNNGVPSIFTFRGAADNTVAWGSVSCYEIKGWNAAGLSTIDPSKNRIVVKQYPAPYSTNSLPIGQINSGYWLLFDRSPTHLRNSNSAAYCWWGAGGTLGNYGPHYSDPCANNPYRDGMGFTEPNYYAGVGYVGDGDSAGTVGTPSSISYSIATVNGASKYEMNRCMLATSYGSTQIKYPGQNGTPTYTIETNGSTVEPTCIDTTQLSGLPFPGTTSRSITNVSPSSGTNVCTLSNTASQNPTVSPAGVQCSIRFTLVGEMPGSLFRLWATAYSPNGTPRTLTNATSVITTKAAAPMRGESYYTNSSDGWAMNNYASRSVAMGFASSVQLQARVDEFDGGNNAFRPGDDQSPLDTVNPGWTKSLTAVAQNGLITTGNECWNVPSGSAGDVSYLNASGVHTSGSTAWTPHATGVPEGWPGTVGCQITPCTVNGGFPHTMKGIQALWNPRSFFNGLDSQLGISVNDLPTKSNGITIRAGGWINYGGGSYARPCADESTWTPDNENAYNQGGHSRFAVVASNGGVGPASSTEINRWVGFGTQPTALPPVAPSSDQCRYLDEADENYTSLPTPENGCLYGWGQPPAPTNLSLGNQVFDPATLETVVEVNWDKVVGAVAYEVSYRHSDALVDTQVTVPATVSDRQSFTISIIGALTSNVKVRAFNANYNPDNPDGHGSNPPGSDIDTGAISNDRYFDGSRNPWSNTVIAEGIALTSPNVTVTAQNSTQHTIGWTSVPTATNYQVYRSVDNENTWNLVTTLGATTTYTSGWSENSRVIYSYYVVAVNTAVNPNPLSDVSNTAYVVPRAVPAISWVNDSSASVSWSAAQILPPGAPMTAVNYTLWIQIGEGTWSDVYTVDSSSTGTLSQTVTGLDRTTNGVVRAYVAASHASTGSRNSEIVQVLGTQLPPTISMGAPDAAQIPLSWTAPAGATGYRLYQSIDGATATQVYAGPATTFNATWTQNRGQQYRFWAVALNTYNSLSENSNVVTAVGTLSTPTITVTTNTTTQTATWTTVPGATGYLLERRVTDKNGTSTAWTAVSGYPQNSTSYSVAWTQTAGEKYEFRVRAQTDYVDGPYSNTGTVFGTVPAPVITAGAYTDASNTITFTWPAISAAIAYDVFLSTEGGPYVTIPLANVTSYVLDRTISSTYTIYIRSKNANVNGAVSNSNSIQILGALSTPTLTATATNATTQTVSWTAVSGATTYLLERRVTNKSGTVGAWGAVAGYPKNETSEIIDWTQTNGERYEYRVRAQTTFVNSAYSNTGTINGTIPDPLLSVEAYVDSSTDIVFTWPAVNAATGYDIYVSTEGGSFVSTSLGNTTTFSLTRTTTVTYAVYVRPKNALYNSATSNSNTITILGVVGIPLLSTSATATTQNISWTSIDGAIDYRLERRITDKNGTVGEWTVVSGYPKNATSETISWTQSNGEKFEYRVRSQTPSVTSSWSSTSTITGTVPAPVITAGSYTDASNTITFTWPAVGAATGYDLYVSTEGGAYILENLGNVTSYVLNRTISSTYSIYVRAKNANVNVPASESNTIQVLGYLPAPTLTASATNSTTQVISWNAISGATTYLLEQRVTNKSGTVSSWTTVSSFPRNATSHTVAWTQSNGEKYEYRVRAQTAFVNSLYSNTGTITGTVPAPVLTNVNYTHTTATTVTFNWTAITAATGYDIYISTEGGSYVMTSLGNVTTYALNRTVSSTYSVYVRAKNSNVNSTASNSNTIQILGHLTTPTLTATATNATTQTISWSSVSGATTYLLEGRVADKTGAVSSWTAVAGYPKNATSETISWTQTLGERYEYRVRAHTAFVNSDWSNTGTITGTVPAPVISAAAYDATTATSITFSWAAITAATEYDIYISTEGGTYITAPLGNTTSYTLNRTTSTTYSVYVRAKNALINSTSSNSNTVTINGYLPAPTLVATATNATTQTISWNAIPGAVTYRLEQRITNKSGTVGSWTAVSGYPKNQTSETIAWTETLGERYEYRVRAHTVMINSNWSNTGTITGTVPAPVLSNNAYTHTTSTSVVFTWPAITAATGYDVYISAEGGTYVMTSLGNVTTYTLNRTVSSTYSVYVRAKNALINTPTSNSNTIQIIGHLATPTLTATATNATTQTISWTAASGATTYTLEQRVTDKTGAVGSWTTVSSYPKLATSQTITWTQTLGERYEYRVRAHTAFVNSDWSNTGAITGTVPAPVISAAAYDSTSATNITFSWAAITAATEYDIYISTDGGSFVSTSLGNTTTYSLNRTISSTYSVYVRAKNALINSATSNSNTITAVGYLPTPVLTATATNATTQTISWTGAPGATSYLLEQRVTNKSGTTGSWTTVSSYPKLATSQTITWTQTNGEKYEYRVRAQTSMVNSSYSNIDIITGTVPAPVLTLGAFDSTTSTTIDFSWTSISAATGYDIYISMNNGTYIKTSLGNATSYEMARTPSVVYNVYVRAMNANVDNIASNSNIATIDGDLGLAPTLTATATNATTQTISWTAVTGATTYLLEQRVTSKTGTVSAWTAVSSFPKNATSQTISWTQTNGEKYEYRARAQTEVINGSWSNTDTITGTVPAPVITAGGYTPASSTSVTFTWPAIAGASGYDVYISTEGGAYVATALGDVTSYTLSRTVSTTYSLYVRAKNSNVNAAASNSNTIQILGVLGTPTLTAVATNATTQTISWTAVTGATTYTLEQRITNKNGTVGSWTAIAGYPKLATSETITWSQTNGEKFEYRVRANTPSVNGAYSNTGTITGTVPAPVISAGTYTPESSTSVTFTWPAVSAATGYDVYISTEGGAYVATALGNVTTYTLSRTVSTTYAVYVRAKNSNVNAAASNSNGIQILGVLGTSTLTATATNATTQTISWTAVTGAATYTLEQRITNKNGTVGSWTTVSGYPKNSTSETITWDQTGGERFEYRVQANTPSVSGAYSNTGTITGTVPAPVITTSAYDPATATNVTFTWPAVSAATGYDVYVSTEGSAYVMTSLGNVTTYNLSRTVTTTYAVYVRAKNSNVNAAASNSSVITVLGVIGTPTLTATATNATTQTISWTAVTGATTYTLEQRITSKTGTVSAWTAIAGYPKLATSQTIAWSQTNGEKFEYRVRANTPSVNGAYSNTGTITGTVPAPVISAGTYTDASTSVVFTWPAVGAASGYDVYISTEGGAYVATALGDVTTYTLSRTVSTTYAVYVRAKNSNANVATSNSNTVQVIGVLSAPTLTAIATNATTQTISWTAASGATTYLLEQRVTNKSGTAGSWTTVSSFPKNATSQTITWTQANGEKFEYRVRAQTPSVNGPYSNTGTITGTVPAPVITAGAYTDSSTSVSFTWPAVSAATGYDVYVSTEGGAYVMTSLGNVTTYNLSRTVTTTYAIYVRAKNSNVNNSASNSNTVTVLGVVGTPTLSANVTNPSTQTISWTAIAGATTYRLEQRITDKAGVAGAWTAVSGYPKNATSQTIAWIQTNGEKFEYRVRAQTPSVNGAFSNTGTIIGTVPSPVIAAGAYNDASTSVTFTWPAVGAASGYDIYISIEGGTATVTSLGNVTNYTLSRSIPVTYDVYVRAKNANVDVIGSNSNTITVLGVLTAPTLTATATNATTQTISWTAVNGATTYLLEQRVTDKTGSIGSWTTVSGFPKNATSQTITWAQTDGEKFEYRARAQTTSVNGPYSNTGTITGTVPAPVITADTYDIPTSTSIGITWPAVASATGYDVYVSTNGGAYASTALGDVTSYTLSRTVTSTYTVYVRAKNANVNAAASNSNTLSLTGFLVAPTLTVGTTTASTIPLSWNTVTGATSYLLQQRIIDKAGVAGAWTDVTGYPKNSTSENITWTQTNGERHQFRVQARNTAVNSSYSGASTVNGTVPAPVLTVAAYTGTTTTLNFSWPAVGAATGYDVYIKTNAGAFVATALGNVTTYAMTRDPANTYSVYVRSKNSNVNAAASNSNTVNISAGVPNAPASLSVSSRTMNYTNSTATGFTLNSSSVTCAFGYPEVQFLQTNRNGTAGSWSDTVQTPAGTSFSSGPVSGSITRSFNSTWGYQGGNQIFQVRARCIGPGGSSAWTVSSNYSFSMPIYNPANAGTLAWNANNYQYTHTAPTCATGTVPRTYIYQNNYTNGSSWVAGTWASKAWGNTTNGGSSGLLTAPVTYQGNHVQITYAAYCVGPQSSSATDSSGFVSTMSQSPSFRSITSSGSIYSAWWATENQLTVAITGCPAGTWYQITDIYYLGGAGEPGNHNWSATWYPTFGGGGNVTFNAYNDNWNNYYWSSHNIHIYCATSWTSGPGWGYWYSGRM